MVSPILTEMRLNSSNDSIIRMQKVELKLLLVLLAFATLIGCSYGHVKSPQNISTMAESKDQQSPPASASNNFLVRKNGWIIPALDQSEIATPRKVFQADKRLYLTLLKPKKTFITDNYFTQEERTALPLKPNFELNVKEIIRFDVDGRIFSYKVRANLMSFETDGRKKRFTSVPMQIALDYYDMDGDGKFEGVKLGDVFGTPQIPAWVN